VLSPILPGERWDEIQCATDCASRRVDPSAGSGRVAPERSPTFPVGECRVSSVTGEVETDGAEMLLAEHFSRKRARIGPAQAAIEGEVVRQLTNCRIDLNRDDGFAISRCQGAAIPICGQANCVTHVHAPQMLSSKRWARRAPRFDSRFCARAHPSPIAGRTMCGGDSLRARATGFVQFARFFFHSFNALHCSNRDQRKTLCACRWSGVRSWPRDSPSLCCRRCAG
jgi:hypothetical protein